MTDERVTRERFEAWICREAPSYSLVPADPGCGTYKEPDTEALWKAWQESAREASTGLRDRFEQVCRDRDHLDLQREGEGYRSRITEERWQIVRGCVGEEAPTLNKSEIIAERLSGNFWEDLKRRVERLSKASNG